MEKIAIRPFHEKYPFAKRDKRSFPQLRLFTPPQHVSISPLAHRSSFHFPSSSSSSSSANCLLGKTMAAKDAGNNNASSSSSSIHRMSVGKESQFLRQQYFLQQRKKRSEESPPLLQTPVAPSIVRPMKSVLQFPLRPFQCKTSTTLRRRLHVTCLCPPPI